MFFLLSNYENNQLNPHQFPPKNPCNPWDPCQLFPVRNSPLHNLSHHLKICSNSNL